MPLSNSACLLAAENCAVEPCPDDFGGTGLACSRCVDDDERLLFAPLHDCLVVADHTSPSLEYRGKHRVCLQEVLSCFQSEWNCAIPKPLQDYINSRELDKELRLTALLAWVKLHTPLGNHWAQWFSSLPAMENVPILSTASEEELQMFRDYAPHFESCAKRARYRADTAWTSAMALAPHIWLNLRNLVPEVHELNHKDPSGDRSSVTDMYTLFQWASMVVSSRCFCLVDDSGNRYACLCPLADFANHDALDSNAKFQLGEVSSSWDSATIGTSQSSIPGLELRARVCMSKGDWVTINYGADKSNALLLESYGFATPASLADRLPWKWRQQQYSAFADMAQFAKDVQRLDANCISVLETRGIDTSTICSGERPPTELVRDANKRRWTMAAINMFDCLTWASDQPTVLQPMPEAPSCVDSDTLLQQQVHLSQLVTVEKQLDKLGCAGKLEDDVPSDPPPSCRIGLWNAVVDFMESVQYVRLFVEEYRQNVLHCRDRQTAKTPPVSS